jgi:protochlorophyllide reductase
VGWTPSDVPDQSGRVALVTGANSGLGLEIARALVERGASVHLGCRDAGRAERAREQLLARVPEARVEVLPLDLADLASVAEAARLLHAREGRLDLLVNNAGLMALDESRTVDGFETQFGVNHLGHFALTLDLLDLLATSPGSRVVVHTSLSHRIGRVRLDDPHFDRRPYRRMGAYYQSKLANLLFVLELDRRLREAGLPVGVLAAHPGIAHTNIGSQGTGPFNHFLDLFLGLGSQRASSGALPALRAALDPAARSGDHYGPRFMAAGAPVLERPARRARDAERARDLWSYSEAATRRRFP